MPFMLVTMFAFALLITLAGFFLSYKSHLHDQKATILQPRPARVRRVIEERRRVDSLPRSISRYDIPRFERSNRVVGNRATRALSIPSTGGRLGRQQAGEPIPWSVVVIGVVSVFVLGLFAFNIVMPHNPVFNLAFLAADNTQTQSTPSANQPQPKLYGASQNLARLGQLDPGQYNSASDYSLWAYSACSTAAMTEVINSYGHQYRIADVLKVEASLGEITPSLGLVEDSGVARTMTKFGFNTNWGYNLSYDQVIATANHGQPVIVAWPPARYDGGHLVVVIGGNSQTVILADSSRYNRQSLSRTQFMKWWAGYSAVATPV